MPISSSNGIPNPLKLKASIPPLASACLSPLNKPHHSLLGRLCSTCVVLVQYSSTLISQLCLWFLAIATTSLRNKNSEIRFHEFFEYWISEQKQHLKDLLAAESSHLRDEELQALNDRVVEHYEYYYKAKSRCAKQDVLAMLSPTWMSSLEEAFHLLYSMSGLQFEAKLDELIKGLRTQDLGDLSASQISQLDEMQRRTILEEREITDLMARHQETVADASMVELSHVVSEMIRANYERGEVDLESNKEIEDKVESTLVPKEEGLEKILLKADELRL